MASWGPWLCILLFGGDAIATTCSSIGIISSSYSKDLVIHQAMKMECHVIVFVSPRIAGIPKMEESSNLYFSCLFFGNPPSPKLSQKIRYLISTGRPEKR